MNWTENEMLAYDKAIIKATDREGSLEIATEEGMAIGLEKGIAQGIVQGIEKGMEKGMEKGRSAERITIAMNLLSSGLDAKTVASATGIPIDQIDVLKQQIKKF